RWRPAASDPAPHQVMLAGVVYPDMEERPGRDVTVHVDDLAAASSGGRHRWILLGRTLTQHLHDVPDHLLVAFLRNAILGSSQSLEAPLHDIRIDEIVHHLGRGRTGPGREDEHEGGVEPRLFDDLH